MGSSQSRRVAETRSNQVDLGSLVTSVIGPNRTFELDALKMSPEFTEVGLEVEDETRGLKAFCTNFVVAEFFSSGDTLYNFLSVITDTFEEAIDLYTAQRGLSSDSIFFTWKGGNILLVVEREFLDELPEYASNAIRKFYAPYFRRSDCDFSIYVRPDLEDYDEIYHEITLLSYRLQDHLRNVFRNDMDLYFDFAKYNKAYKERILKEWLDRLNVELDAEYTDFRPSLGGADLTLRFVEDDYPGVGEPPVRQAAKSIIKDDGSIFKITHNDQLDFPNPNGARVRFNLTRTKTFFKLIESNGKAINVGGELIDVSVSHRDDNNLPYFFETLEKNVTTYTLKLPDDSELKFKSLTIAYLIKDLSTILFKFNYLPWEDNKYSKRLQRLIYLLFVDMFIKIKDPSQRMSVLNNLKSTFMNLNHETIDIFEEFHKKYDLHLLQFIDNIRLVMNRVDEPESTEEDVSEFEKLKELVKENIKFLNGVLKNLRIFCSTEGKTSEKNIYMAKLSSIV